MPKHYTPNDMRSISKNPTSKAFAADYANRLALGHELPPTPPVAPAAPEPTSTPVTPDDET